MKHYFTLLLIASLTAACTAPEDDSYSGATGSATEVQTGTAGTQLTAKDASFLKEAASSGLMEVELGRLASQQGSSQATKDFGRHLMEDHTKANQELTVLAGRKGATPPSTMDEKHQKIINKLAKLQGQQFDEAFHREATRAHEKDIALFEKATQTAEDMDVKAFAQKNLPTLRHHLQMAKGINTGSTATTESPLGTPGSTTSDTSDPGSTATPPAQPPTPVTPPSSSQPE